MRSSIRLRQVLAKRRARTGPRMGRQWRISPDFHGATEVELREPVAGESADRHMVSAWIIGDGPRDDARVVKGPNCVGCIAHELSWMDGSMDKAFRCSGDMFHGSQQETSAGT